MPGQLQCFGADDDTFDSLKRSLIALFVVNLIPGLSGSQQGCMQVAMLKVWQIWLRKPNQEQGVQRPLNPEMSENLKLGPKSQGISRKH